MTKYPTEVDVFAARAREFIDWCRSEHAGKSAEEVQREALVQLSRVYASALDLPGVDFVPAPEPPDQTQEQRSKLAANLSALPFQYYWEVFTPTDQEDHEPVCGDLFDDFLDICGDLAQPMALRAKAL